MGHETDTVGGRPRAGSMRSHDSVGDGGLAALSAVRQRGPSSATASRNWERLGYWQRWLGCSRRAMCVLGCRRPTAGCFVCSPKRQARRTWSRSGPPPATPDSGSLVLRQTGGRLTTFEIDPRRAATAREFFRKAGLDGQATVVVGDAHQTLATLKDPIDAVFMDADKEGYVDYLKRLLPLLKPGGVILAHNIRQAPDYLQYVAANPDLETVLLVQSSGLTATLKKR